MKNRDLLDILGEIDEELVVDAAPDRESAKPQKIKKKGSSWVKYASFAACCVLILGGVMTSRHFFDDINHPSVVDSETSAAGDKAPTPAETDAKVEGTILSPVPEGTEGRVEEMLPGDFDSPEEEVAITETEGEVLPEWSEDEDEVKDEVETDGVGNAVSDFAGVLESVGDVKLDKTVRYRETVIGFAPSHFTLNADMLEAICEVLYICNGTPVYDKDIDGEADECVILANTGKYTVGFAVYSNGYIGVNGIYYEVGTELTQKIINVVKTEGKAPSNMFWNEEEECWQTYGPDEDVPIEPDDTAHIESEDIEYAVEE